MKFEDISCSYEGLSDRPLLDTNLSFKNLTAEQKFWQENGYLIIPGLIPEELIESYIDVRKTCKSIRGWGGAPYLYFDEVKNLSLYRPMVEVLKNLLLDDIILHLNLTGWVSSERNWHQDEYLNPRNVKGSYIATWIALADIHPDSGPFQFVPGSHKWNVLDPVKIRSTLSDFEASQEGLPGHAGHWAEHSQEMVSNVCEEFIFRKGGKILEFLPKKGDVLIWHSCLLHRGSAPRNPDLQRKAFISHYSGKTNRTDFPPENTIKYGSGFYQKFDYPLYF